MNWGDTSTLWLLVDRLHLIYHLKHKQQLTIRCTRSTIKHFCFACEVSKAQFVSWIKQSLLVIQLLFISFPRLTVRRISYLIAESLALEVVFSNSVTQMHSARIDTFDNQVWLTDSISLWVDFGTRQQNSAIAHTQIEQEFATLS